MIHLKIGGQNCFPFSSLFRPIPNTVVLLHIGQKARNQYCQDFLMKTVVIIRGNSNENEMHVLRFSHKTFIDKTLMDNFETH